MPKSLPDRSNYGKSVASTAGVAVYPARLLRSIFCPTEASIVITESRIDMFIRGADRCDSTLVSAGTGMVLPIRWRLCLSPEVSLFCGFGVKCTQRYRECLKGAYWIAEVESKRL